MMNLEKIRAVTKQLLEISPRPLAGAHAQIIHPD